MAKLIQCVPNFSEGKRLQVIRQIAEAIDSVEGVRVVDFSGDVDHNRSVITMVGEPEAVRAGMLAGARVAVEKIDMNEHFGGHPRIGAIDVVPVIPLQDITMEECVEISRKIGRDFAEKLGIPVYFYEYSATSHHRKSLPALRKGGIEKLKGVKLTGDLAPDIGPPKIHPTAGASVIGARNPLIAYNVNLDTDRIHIANEIARKIRQVRHEGTLVGVRAIGVHLASRGIVQVSTNITEPDKTSVWDVYHFVETQAADFGVEVLESELIGALRLDAVVGSAAQALKMPTLTARRVIDTWF